MNKVNKGYLNEPAEEFCDAVDSRNRSWDTELDAVAKVIHKMGADPYNSLRLVLNEAYAQASEGKGKERHAKDEERFEDQKICEITRRVGQGYPLGQAIKKIIESDRLDGEDGVAELLGAINYIAAAIITRRK